MFVREDWPTTTSTNGITSSHLRARLKTAVYAELQSQMLQHIGQLDLEAAIDIWFVRDCCAGNPAEEREGK